MQADTAAGESDSPREPRITKPSSIRMLRNVRR